jgi:hypothetical protein
MYQLLTLIMLLEGISCRQESDSGRYISVAERSAAAGRENIKGR